MKSFEEMGLSEALMNTLQRMQFTLPTPIQQEAIPVALNGKDILGVAQTGTGKTAAFGIPLVSKLLSSSEGVALVMTPTRELATQVAGQLRKLLGEKSSIRTTLLIGGDSIVKQLKQLRSRPRLIVGTPGRVNDHLRRGSLDLRRADFFVLDETDRMLDMGFSVQIESIVQHMPSERQTLLFSATMPKNIIGIAERYLEDPVTISVGAMSRPSENIKQEILRIKESEKYGKLLSELRERQGSVIVFVKTKHGTEKMAIKLSKEGFFAEAIHGDMRQKKRDHVIRTFRKKRCQILVATDVAARGLDIPHIEHVINYDLPQCPEDYVHRIGRTARAGDTGCALSFVTPGDRGKWGAIDRFLNPDAKPSRPPRREGQNKRPFRRNDRSRRRGFSVAKGR